MLAFNVSYPANIRLVNVYDPAKAYQNVPHKYSRNEVADMRLSHDGRHLFLLLANRGLQMVDISQCVESSFTPSTGTSGTSTTESDETPKKGKSWTDAIGGVAVAIVLGVVLGLVVGSAVTALVMRACRKPASRNIQMESKA